MGVWEDAERSYNKYKYSEVSKMDIPSTYGKPSKVLDSIRNALCRRYNESDRIGCFIERRPFGRNRIIVFDVENFDIYHEYSIGRMSPIKISLKGNVLEANEYEREDDIMPTKHDCAYPSFWSCGFDISKITNDNQFHYKEVIFNPPATIINWQDGTKTVVKCREGDVFDHEKAIALCFMKKALGNNYGYYNTMKNILEKSIKQCKKKEQKALKKLGRNMKKKKGEEVQNGKSDS